MDTKEYYLDAFVDYLNKSDKSSGTISTYTANIIGFIKYYVESYGKEFFQKSNYDGLKGLSKLSPEYQASKSIYHK